VSGGRRGELRREKVTHAKRGEQVPRVPHCQKEKGKERLPRKQTNQLIRGHDRKKKEPDSSSTLLAAHTKEGGKDVFIRGGRQPPG